MFGKKKLSNGDMSFDNDLNLPDFDFGSEPVEDNRSPITQIKDGLKTGMKKKLVDPATYMKLGRKMLPEEFGQTVDSIDNTITSAKKVYEGAIKEVKPALSEFAKAADKMVPESYKKSKETLKRIADWGQQSNSSGTSPEQQREANIGIELGKIFQFQMEEQTKAGIKDDADKKLQEVIGFKRHKDQMTALNAIALDSSTLNQYTTRITSAFQKKSLEFQLRSYYVQADMLQEMKRVNAENKTAFASIVKNTGLPDYVKTRFTERSREELRNNLIGGLFAKQQKFVETLGANVGKMISNTAKDAAMALSMGATGMEMAETMSDLGFGPKKTGKERVAEFAGEMGIAGIAHLIGKKFHDKVAGNEKLALMANKLGFLNKYGIEGFDKWALKTRKIEYDDEGNEKITLKDRALDLIKNLYRSVRPGKTADVSLEKDEYAKANEAGIFSNKTNRSITEIIPGYLSRILREISVLRTGDEKTDLIEFDYKSSKFIKSKTKSAQILGSIVTDSDKEGMAHQTERMFRDYFKDRDFSPEEKKLFTQFMISQNLKGNFNTVQDLSKSGTYRGTEVEHIADKFAQSFRDNFNVDSDGKLAETSEAWKKSNDFQALNETLQHYIKDPRNEIQKRINAGDLNHLRELGLLDENDNLNLTKLKELLTEKSGQTTEAASDINLKENIRKFSPKLALNKIKDLGVDMWNYKPTSGYMSDKQFVGPMAQDVNRRFGEEAAPDGKKLNLINMNGIALSAIKGLSEELGSLKKQASGFFQGFKDKFTPEEKPTAVDESVKTDKQKNEEFMKMFQNSTPGKRLDEFYSAVNKNIADYEASKKVSDTQSQEEAKPTVLKSFQDQVVELLTASRIHLKGIEDQVTQGSLLSLFNMPGLAGATEHSKEIFKKALKKLEDSKLKETLVDITGALPKPDTIKGRIASIGKDSFALGKMSFEKAFNAFTLLSGKQAAAIKNTSSELYQNFLKPITGKFFGSIKDKATRAVDRYTKGIADIYIEGEDKPRIEYMKLKNGDYYKSSSGKILESFMDIDDDIFVKHTNVIVLRMSEIDKAYMKDTLLGKTIKLKDALSSQARSMIARGNAVRKVFTDFSIRNLKSAGKALIDMLDEPRDIYIKGESTPRLSVIGMRGGHYLNRVAGTRIYRPSDIKDEVVDDKGNILISKEDALKGLVDAKGDPIKSPLQKLLGIGKASIGLGAGIIRNALRRGTRLFDTVFGNFKGLTMPSFQKLFDGAFGFNDKSNELLTQIRDILDSRLGGVSGSTRRRNRKQKQGQTSIAGLAIGSPTVKENQPATLTSEQTKGYLDVFINKSPSKQKKAFDEKVKQNNNENEAKKAKIDKEKVSAAKPTTSAEVKEKPKSRLQRFKEKVSETFKPKEKKEKTKLEEMREERDAKRKLGEGPKSYFTGNIFDVIQSTIGSTVSGLLGFLSPGGKLGKLGKLGGAAKTAGGALALGAAGAAGASMLGGGSAGSEGGSTESKGITAGDVVQNAVGDYLGLKALGKAGTILKYAGKGLLGVGRFGGGALLGAGRLALMGGGALIPALGAVLASPLGLALGVGLAGYGAYKGIKWLLSKKFSTISKFRMAQYGFNNGDEKQLQAVYDFEKIMQKSVKFDDEGQASIAKNDYPSDKIFNLFGVSTSNPKQVDNLFSWIEKRFKPVFLTHMSVYKQVLDKDTIDAIDDATPQQQDDVLPRVKMPNGPWDEVTSPFPEFKQLTVTGAELEQHYELTRRDIAKLLDKDKKEKKEKGLPEEKTYNEKRSEAGVEGSEKKISSDSKESTNLPNINKPKSLTEKGSNVEVYSQALKSISSKSLSAAEAIRFKAYGLTSMEALKVMALRILEQDVMSSLIQKDKETVSWNGNPKDIVKKYKAQFEFSFDDYEQEEKWIKWFLQRFLPVLTTYAAQLMKETGYNTIEQAQADAKPQHLLNACLAVLNLKDAWRLKDSPWLLYTLGNSTESCEENIEFLKKQIRDQKETEEKISKQKMEQAKQQNLAAMDSSQKNASKAETLPESQSYDAMGNATGITYERSATASPLGQADPTEKDSSPGTDGGSQSTISTNPNKADGSIMQGTGADQYIKLLGGAKLNGMQPEMLKLLRGMIEEYGTKTGKKVFITQAFRSFWDQVNIFKKSPEKAAKPGTSLHEKGLAVDISSTTVDEMEKLGLMKKYGFTRPVGQEPWHVEPAGIQANLRTHQKDPVAANQAIVAGIGKGGLGWGTEKNAAKLSRNPEMAKQLLNAAGTEVAENKQDSNGVNVAVNEEQKDNGVTQAQTSTPGSASAYQDMPKAENGGYKNMEPTIEAAAKATGMDKKTLTGIFGVESNFNPNAKAKTSSATGMGQITKATFDELKAKYGKQYNIPDDATVLDPKANAILTAAYAKENKDKLSKYKKNVTDTDVYMSHFLGSNGYKKFDSLRDDEIPANAMPKQAAANYNVFYNKDGTPKTKQQIYQSFEQKFNKYASLADGPTKPEGPVQLASFIPKPKPMAEEPTPVLAKPIEQPTQTSPAIAAFERIVRQPDRPAITNDAAASSFTLNNQLSSSMASIEGILSSSLTVQKDILSTVKTFIDIANKKSSSKETPKDVIDPTTKEPVKKMTSFTPNKNAYPTAEAPISLANRTV